jgi:hypothetical protein
MVFNPFQPAADKEKYIKVLVYGKAKIGKTWAAISSFKDNALIDTEHGSDLYAKEMHNRGNPFDVIHDKNLKSILSRIKWLNKNEHKYKTLIIDSITIAYQGLLEDMEKAFNLPKENMRYWSEVKKTWNSFLRECLGLNMNVVLIAHEKNNYKSNEGGGMPEIDSVNPYTFDAGKGTDHYMDTIIRFFMDKDERKAKVIGSRHQDFKNGAVSLLTETYFSDRISEAVINISPKVAEMIDSNQLAFINKCFQILETSDESIVKLLDDSFGEESISELTKTQADELITKLKNSKKLKAATRKKNSEKEGK